MLQSLSAIALQRALALTGHPPSLPHRSICPIVPTCITMLRSLIWFGLTWIAGSALILGSLMTLGSLLLWLVPVETERSTPTTSQSPESTARAFVVFNTWRHRVRLLLFSVGLAIAGGAVLQLTPFPG